MKELIKITEQNGKQAVSARELHAFLESKQDFSNWVNNRIKKYGLVENQDYQRFNKIIETGGRSIEYVLSIDCAKELSMVEGNVKGKQARKYFISCENKLRELINNQLRIAQESARQRLVKSTRLREIDATISGLMRERKVIIRDLNEIDRADFQQLSLFNNECQLSLGFPKVKILH
jgi:anti-repressor protein